MNLNIKKTRNQIIAPAVVIIFLILMVAFVLLTNLHNDNILRKNAFIIEHLNTFVQAEIEEDAESFIGLFEIVKDNKAIQAAWKKKDRNVLFSSSVDIFKTLHKSHRITHFYFHGLKKFNFLRVHMPDRFGDEIKRFTLDEAVRTQKTEFGIEIGVFGQIVLRVVSPWYIDGELVGYIEFGEEIEHILEKSATVLGTRVVTLIRKDVLNQREWELQSNLLGRRALWDEFSEYVVVESARISDIHSFYPVIRSGMATRSTGEIVKQAGNFYFTNNYPITDVKSDWVGSLVFFSDITEEVISKRHLTWVLFGLGFIFSSILMWLYFIYVSRIERVQQNTFQRLTDEMLVRMNTEEALRQAKEEAEHASNVKTAFLNQMSHEFRTPLNAIVGFCHLLDYELQNDQHKIYVEKILSAGENLLEMVNKVLSFSDIEANKVKLNIQVEKLAPLIQESIALVLPLAQKKRIDLIKDIDIGVDVLADAALLKQVLVNILSNAIKFNREGSSVRIFTDGADDGMIKISIADTGKGMSEDELSKVFQPFERLSERNMTIEGAGVGLAICKQLVERMNGRIGAKSTLGKGSCFWLELPVNKE